MRRAETCFAAEVRAKIQITIRGCKHRKIVSDWQNHRIKSEEIVAMDIQTTDDAVREELFKADQTFRNLVRQHQNYEKRLTELSELTYPNDEELLEESALKKKKLILKDEIFQMIQNHSKSH